MARRLISRRSMLTPSDAYNKPNKWQTMQIAREPIAYVYTGKPSAAKVSDKAPSKPRKAKVGVGVDPASGRREKYENRCMEVEYSMDPQIRFDSYDITGSRAQASTKPKTGFTPLSGGSVGKLSRF